MATLAFCGSNSIALAKFSRACSIDGISSIQRNSVLRLFDYIGVSANGSFSNLATFTLNQLRNYWVLESLTTDYGETRYYLYAEAKAYRYYDRVSATIPAGYQVESSYRSGNWTAERVPQEILNDPQLSSIFHSNRQYLYSARAGDLTIVRYIPNALGFRVRGNHYIYEPLVGTRYLGYSDAADCNLTQWGIEQR